MIMDELLEFADAGSIAGAAGTALLGDVWDTGGDGINDVDDLYLVIIVSETVTSAGAATVSFALASDAQAAIAVDGTATVHFQTPALALADLTAGSYVARVALPKDEYERYVGVLVTTAVATTTGGAVNAFLTRHPPTYKAFPQAAGASIA